MVKGGKSSPLKVRIERTGGFAAIPLTLNIDSESLPVEQADQLRELVESSDFLNLASKNVEPFGAPDRFLYILTLEIEGRRHTVRTGEDDMPPQLKPLIDYLIGIARKLRSGIE